MKKVLVVGGAGFHLDKGKIKEKAETERVIKNMFMTSKNKKGQKNYL